MRSTCDAQPFEAARGARAEARILEATLCELATHGFAGLTVEGIAHAAGVGRATIYRHWPTKSDLVMAAVRSISEGIPVAATGTVRGDLTAAFEHLARLLSDSPAGGIIPALLEAASRDPELGRLHQALVDDRRRAIRSILQRGVERGELRPDADLEVVIDLLAGAVFYRHLVLRLPTRHKEVAALIEAVLVSMSPAPDEVGPAPPPPISSALP